MRVTIPLLLGLTCLLAAVGASTASRAQESSCSGDLTSVEMVRCLKPASRSLAATRGLSPDCATQVAAGGRGVRIEGAQAPCPEDHPSINLQVTFDYNSARLTTDAEIALERLGRALSDPRLVDYHFQVAGHTDAAGSEGYNQKLSEERAAVVAAYLEQKFGVSPARLEALGFGKTRLLDTANPLAGINRRVQVTNLGMAP